MTRYPKNLDRFFLPETIAVIGATARPFSVGRTLMNNLLTAPFRGTIFPVNPRHATVCGLKCYPKIGAIHQRIDLAIIATPAETVPGLIAECVEAKVSSAVIISAGFKECGAEGIEREEQILFHSRGRLRVIGPNCLGIMRPSAGLNATFAHGMSLSGSVAFLSQSGALCTAVLDWSLREKTGFSALVSIGSMIDVGWGELIEYFGRDPKTRSILIYMESIGDAADFMRSAGKIARTKPIFLLKAGRRPESSRAAVSHTGSMASNDEVFSAAMQSAGVLQIETIAELFHIADCLAKQPIPKGPYLTMITNAGGPAVVATDALAEMGGLLTSLGPKAVRLYDHLLTAHRSHNPVDIRGDAGADQFEKAVQIAAKESGSDGILVILSPQDMTDPTETARRLEPYRSMKRPIMASWMGGGSVEKGKKLLNQHQIPTFEFPDLAARIFALLGKYAKASKMLRDRKIPVFHDVESGCVENMIVRARSEKRAVLDEYESKKILEAYGVETVRTEIAFSPSEAVKAAKDIGYPVVLKVFSCAIAHKMKEGGVELDLRDERSVIDAFMAIRKAVGTERFSGVAVEPMVNFGEIELICGSTTDDQFGPVLMLGFGGRLVEWMNARTLALPPLSKADARRMIEQTKIVQALKSRRGGNMVDTGHLEEILMRFSSLIAAHPAIKELDINPLVESSGRFIALDARVVLV